MLSGTCNILGHMTDPADAAPGSITSSRRPKRSRVDISELTMIVRPPGDPSAVQAFTEAEAAEARQYAAAMDAEVEPLAGARVATDDDARAVQRRRD